MSEEVGGTWGIAVCPSGRVSAAELPGAAGQPLWLAASAGRDHGGRISIPGRENHRTGRTCDTADLVSPRRERRAAETQVDDHQLDPDEKFRGSGAWLDDADTGLHLSRVAHGKLLLTFTKTRSCEEQPPLPLSLHTDTLLLYATADQQAKRSIDWWKAAHPTGSLQELERYLLASFVASPRVIAELVYGTNGRSAQQIACPGSA